MCDIELHGSVEVVWESDCDVLIQVPRAVFRLGIEEAGVEKIITEAVIEAPSYTVSGANGDGNILGSRRLSRCRSVRTSLRKINANTYGSLKLHDHGRTSDHLSSFNRQSDRDGLRKCGAGKCCGTEKLSDHDSQLSSDSGGVLDTAFPKHHPFYNGPSRRTLDSPKRTDNIVPTVR